MVGSADISLWQLFFMVWLVIMGICIFSNDEDLLTKITGSLTLRSYTRFTHRHVALLAHTKNQNACMENPTMARLSLKRGNQP